LKAVSGKRMGKLLEARGWAHVRTTSSHHIYKHPGSPTLVSVPVHGNRDLTTGMQRTIMRQAGLTEADL